MSIEEEVKALKRIASFHDHKEEPPQEGFFLFLFHDGGGAYYLAEDYRYVRLFSAKRIIVRRNAVLNFLNQKRHGHNPSLDRNISCALYLIPKDQVYFVESAEVPPSMMTAHVLEQIKLEGNLFKYEY